MKIQITYLKSNTTQIFDVIDQDLFDQYRDVKAMYDSDDWDKLPDQEKDSLNTFLNDNDWLGVKIKEGDFCTTKSAIYSSAMREDGKLILPLIQGGSHDVETKIINEDKELVEFASNLSLNSIFES